MPWLPFLCLCTLLLVFRLCSRWLVGAAGSELPADALPTPCLFRKAGKIEIQTSDGPLQLRRCVTGPSDIMYVPDRWAHATCGLSSFNVGVGFIGSVSLLPPLHRASVTGDLRAAQAALRSMEPLELLRPAGAGMLNEDGLSPLQWAAWNGHLPLVKLLLRTQETAHETAAHAIRWAAARGHGPVVTYLVRRLGNALDEQGLNSVRLASAPPTHCEEQLRCIGQQPQGIPLWRSSSLL